MGRSIPLSSIRKSPACIRETTHLLEGHGQITSRRSATCHAPCRNGPCRDVDQTHARNRGRQEQGWKYRQYRKSSSNPEYRQYRIQVCPWKITVDANPGNTVQRLNMSRMEENLSTHIQDCMVLCSETGCVSSTGGAVTLVLRVGLPSTRPGMGGWQSDLKRAVCRRVLM